MTTNGDFRRVESWALVCERCGHHWVPKGTEGVYEMKTPPKYPKARPRICPNCKTAYWDVPKPKA